MAREPETLRQMAEHICYEVDQLQGCVALIKGGQFRVELGGESRVVANALLESALVHVRSLDDFFGSTRTASSRVDDIFATDFDPDWAVSRVLNDRERELVNKGSCSPHYGSRRRPQRWELDICLKAVNLFGNFLDGLELHQRSVRGWFKAERATVTFRRF